MIDADLSEDMEAARRVVSLGLTARNAAGVNVRRPLAELRVFPAGDAGRRAVDRFAALIADELNVRCVKLADKPLLGRSAGLNPKTAKARFKGKPEPAVAALAGLDADAVAADLAAGTFSLLGVALSAEDIIVSESAPEGWAGAADRGTQVALDTRITPELKAEGLARDVVRFVQNARKDAGLDVADRIELFLGTDDAELRAAVDAHWPTIAAEVQATRRLDAPPADAFTAAVTVDGRPLTIALRKV